MAYMLAVNQKTSHVYVIESKGGKWVASVNFGRPHATTLILREVPTIAHIDVPVWACEDHAREPLIWEAYQDPSEISTSDVLGLEELIHINDLR